MPVGAQGCPLVITEATLYGADLSSRREQERQIRGKGRAREVEATD